MLNVLLLAVVPFSFTVILAMPSGQTTTAPQSATPSAASSLPATRVYAAQCATCHGPGAELDVQAVNTLRPGGSAAHSQCATERLPELYEEMAGRK